MRGTASAKIPSRRAPTNWGMISVNRRHPWDAVNVTGRKPPARATPRSIPEGAAHRFGSDPRRRMGFQSLLGGILVQEGSDMEESRDAFPFGAGSGKAVEMGRYPQKIPGLPSRRNGRRVASQPRVYTACELP